MYDEKSIIVDPNSRNLMRADTGNSHKTEKNLAKEYISQLYEFGIDKVKRIKFTILINLF